MNSRFITSDKLIANEAVQLLGRQFASVDPFTDQESGRCRYTEPPSGANVVMDAFTCGGFDLTGPKTCGVQDTCLQCESFHRQSRQRVLRGK